MFDHPVVMPQLRLGVGQGRQVARGVRAGPARPLVPVARQRHLPEGMAGTAAGKQYLCRGDRAGGQFLQNGQRLGSAPVGDQGIGQQLADVATARLGLERGLRAGDRVREPLELQLDAGEREMVVGGGRAQRHGAAERRLGLARLPVRRQTAPQVGVQLCVVRDKAQGALECSFSLGELAAGMLDDPEQDPGFRIVCVSLHCEARVPPGVIEAPLPPHQVGQVQVRHGIAGVKFNGTAQVGFRTGRVGLVLLDQAEHEPAVRILRVDPGDFGVKLLRFGDPVLVEQRIRPLQQGIGIHHAVYS